MIIDTPWRTTEKLDGLKAAGVHTILRYYNHKNSRTLHQKCLTPDEAKAISDAGLSIGVIFQQRQDRLSDFTPKTGKSAAEKALERAIDEIGQPENSAIFFAVDFNVDTASEVDTVKGYFSAVREAFAEADVSYRVGGYGCGHILAALGDAGLIDLSWLAMARGWHGSREFHASNRWGLNQTQETIVTGLDVDLNDANPDHPDFGQFRLGDAPITPPLSSPLHVVQARSGLWLRAGPGTDFEKQRLLPFGQVVHVMGFQGDWAQVDLEGDGKIDGHSHSAFLQRR